MGSRWSEGAQVALKGPRSTVTVGGEGVRVPTRTVAFLVISKYLCNAVGPQGILLGAMIWGCGELILMMGNIANASEVGQDQLDDGWRGMPGAEADE